VDGGSSKKKYQRGLTRYAGEGPPGTGVARGAPAGSGKGPLGPTRSLPARGAGFAATSPYHGRQAGSARNETQQSAMMAASCARALVRRRRHGRGQETTAGRAAAAGCSLGVGTSTILSGRCRSWAL